ncbi:hypothetical protein [Agrococcus beijingensis]|uniref:hypothetical protein n=1 Tax=Agrococcus beijingensis TaxID=3068634 RepID=UPI002741E9EF|nr:hypothetical protein [Agrococcus sp. REN33]
MRSRARARALIAIVAAGVLALTGCGAESAPEPGTASDPPAASASPSAAASPTPDAAAAPEASAAPDASAAAAGPSAAQQRLLDACESNLMAAMESDRPERGRNDDQIQVYEAMGTLLPTRPTCWFSQAEGDRRAVVMVWFDAPETGPAVIAGLEALDWSASTTPADGYETTTLTDGSTDVEVSPLGLESGEQGVGQLWEGDVTLIEVLLPAPAE